MVFQMIISGSETSESPYSDYSNGSTFSKNYRTPNVIVTSGLEGTWMGIAIGSLCLLIIVVVVQLIWFRKEATNLTKVEEQRKTTTSAKQFQSSNSVPLALVLKGSIPIPLKDEFRKLLKFEDGLSQRFTISQGKRYNKIGGFNLVPDNVPFDHNRVRLKTPVEGCYYVNASWISSLTEDSTYDELIYTTYLPYKNIKFAIGQNPLPATMQHHYRMILENQFEMLIRFNGEGKQSDFHVGKQYLFGDVSLKIRSMKHLAKHLIRSEISITDKVAKGVQNTHHTVCFDLNSWPEMGLESLDEVDNLVLSICLIRNEMKSQSSLLKVFAHDSRGGVRDASTFVALYDLFHQIDQGLSDDNIVKASAQNINIFNTVNQLRNDRANAIENFDTYRNLFYCLNHYGQNRSRLQQDMGKMARILRKDEKVRQRNEKRGNALTSINEQFKTEYVLDDPSYEGENNEILDFYDNSGLKAKTYVNIEEMSEYI